MLKKCKELLAKLQDEDSDRFTKILVADVIVATKSIVEIVDYAHNLNADLVIAGTRGRSGVKRILLGSVASGIVTYVHCPVLVVK